MNDILILINLKSYKILIELKTKQYILTDYNESEVFGMSNLRLELNDYLFQNAGHIGYSISPKCRSKGLEQQF